MESENRLHDFQVCEMKIATLDLKADEDLYKLN